MRRTETVPEFVPMRLTITAQRAVGIALRVGADRLQLTKLLEAAAADAVERGSPLLGFRNMLRAGGLLDGDLSDFRAAPGS